MPDPDDHPPSRLARALSVARWVAVWLLLALVAFRYGVPYFVGDPDVVAVKSDDPASIDDLKDKLNPPTQAFSNPVARRLVDLGTDLVARPRDRQDAARQLLELTDNPEQLGDDMTAYLALRSAYWQLRRDPQVRGSLETALLLWDTAEHLERNSALAAVTGDTDDSGVK
jgi:hypothetical protein